MLVWLNRRPTVLGKPVASLVSCLAIFVRQQLRFLCQRQSSERQSADRDLTAGTQSENGRAAVARCNRIEFSFSY